MKFVCRQRNYVQKVLYDNLSAISNELTFRVIF